jgi:phosphatidate cytidylyltransferase
VEPPDSALAEPSVAPRRAGGLTLRILSSLVMIPLALAAVWFGAPFLPALAMLAGAGMGWEWARLSRTASPVAVCLIIAAPFVAACAATVGDGAAGVLIALIFAIVVALSERRVAARAWAAAGLLWIALPCVAILWLDRMPDGRAAIIMLLAVVWASDIGAYVFGRLIGGPKLAPALSPNKTWAGAVGGLICALLVGVAAAHIARASAGRVIPVTLVVGIAAQLGDLAESFAKRHFGVKDSGALIPGHGGLLDRLDSLLAAAMVLALAVAASPLPIFSNVP